MQLFSYLLTYWCLFSTSLEVPSASTSDGSRVGDVGKAQGLNKPHCGRQERWLAPQAPTTLGEGEVGMK